MKTSPLPWRVEDHGGWVIVPNTPGNCSGIPHDRSHYDLIVQNVNDYGRIKKENKKLRDILFDAVLELKHARRFRGLNPSRMVMDKADKILENNS